MTTCSPLIGPGYSPLQFSDALYLATRGSAALLNLEHSLGALQPGHLADMLLVDMEGNIAVSRITLYDVLLVSAHSNTRLFGGESFLDIVSKFVFLADDRNIKNVWVSGKLVKS